MTASYAEIFIGDIKATRVDIRAGTEGACGEFALMLNDALSAIGVHSRIGMCCDSDDGREIRDPATGDLMCWAHFIVESEGRLFDIRGEVNSADIHREFCTDSIVFVDRPEAERCALSARPDIEIILDAAEKYCIHKWRSSFERNCGIPLPMAA